MAVAYVTGGGAGGFFTACTLSVPSGVAVGDVLVAIVGKDRGALPTLPSGWVDSPGALSGGHRGRMATRVADGTEAASYSFGASDAVWQGFMAVYRGCSVGASGSFNSTTLAYIRAPSVTSIASGAWLVNGFFQAQGPTVSWTYPGTTTVRYTQYGNNGAFAPKIGLGDETLGSTGASGVRDVTLPTTYANHGGFALVLESVTTSTPAMLHAAQRAAFA